MLRARLTRGDLTLVRPDAQLDRFTHEQQHVRAIALAEHEHVEGLLVPRAHALDFRQLGPLVRVGLVTYSGNGALHAQQTMRDEAAHRPHEEIDALVHDASAQRGSVRNDERAVEPPSRLLRRDLFPVFRFGPLDDELDHAAATLTLPMAIPLRLAEIDREGRCVIVAVKRAERHLLRRAQIQPEQFRHLLRAVRDAHSAISSTEPMTCTAPYLRAIVCCRSRD